MPEEGYHLWSKFCVVSSNVAADSGEQGVDLCLESGVDDNHQGNCDERDERVFEEACSATGRGDLSERFAGANVSPNIEAGDEAVHCFLLRTHVRACRFDRTLTGSER